MRSATRSTWRYRRAWAAAIAAATLALMTATGPARAADPAAFAPADSAIYIEVSDLAKIRADIANDPLVQRLREQLPSARQPQAWQELQVALGLTGDQIVDRYFGERVALIVEREGEGAPGVVLSRVGEADARHAIDRLALQHDGAAGRFTIYHTSDGKALIAFGDGWMAMGDPKHAGYIRQVLEGGAAGGGLTADAAFRNALAELPAQRSATLFARNEAKGERFAAALVRQGGDFSIHLVGRSPDLTNLLSMVGPARQGDLGPLPPSTIAVAAVNLINRDLEPAASKLLNTLVAPRSFERDVLPNLDAPVTLLLADVPGESVEPAVGFRVPVVAMSIRMRDAAVAADLQKMCDNLVMLGNLGLMQKQIDPVTIEVGRHGEHQYRVVELGPVIEAQFGRPRLSGMLRLAYGRVGDRFVIVSHETLMTQWLDAAEVSGEGVSTAQRFAPAAGEGGAALLAASVRADRLGAMLRSWHEHVAQVRPELLAASRQADPQEKPAMLMKVIGLAADVLGEYDRIMLRVDAGDGSSVRAVLHVKRRR